MGGVGTFAKWGLVCSLAFIFHFGEPATRGSAFGETKKVKKTPPKQAKSKKAEPAAPDQPYRGPLRLFVFDFDFNVVVDRTSMFRVFRWNEAGSPYLDYASTRGIPEFIDVPMEDWERGVRSEVQQYDQMPIKHLVGRYYDGGMSVQDPGNSYYDREITLSSGAKLNPRSYYADPLQTYRPFRTPLSGEMPLVEAVSQMIKTKQFGPVFPLFALSSNPNLPVSTSILTYRGHNGVEWDAAKDLLINAEHLSPGAQVERVYALSNPALTVNDPTSVSQFMEPHMSLAKLKVKILEHLIQNVLLRRFDRENPANPRPNVLVYAEDDIEILERVRDLFASTARAVRDLDRERQPAQPPIRLILVNTAPQWIYAPVPTLLKHKPQALANDPIDLAPIMIFDSRYRNVRGGEAVQKFGSDQMLIKVVSSAFDVSERVAKQVLNGKMDCRKLLLPSQGLNE